GACETLRQLLHLATVKFAENPSKSRRTDPHPSPLPSEGRGRRTRGIETQGSSRTRNPGLFSVTPFGVRSAVHPRNTVVAPKAVEPPNRSFLGRSLNHRCCQAAEGAFALCFGAVVQMFA